MRWNALLLFALGTLSACVVGEDGITPVDPDGNNDTPRGVVTEPSHGALLSGDPWGLVVRVGGLYSFSDRELAIQVLTNPDDLASWQTIGTARTAATAAPNGDFAFEAEVVPVQSAADTGRWPAGGVLRLRVIDGDGRALPHDEAVPEDTTLIVASPGLPPVSWDYLLEQPTGSIAETLEYYAATNAAPTLDEFIARHGFPGNEIAAAYYNAGDLAIGRDMHCRALPNGGAACYVRNYGSFGGSRLEAISLLELGGAPLATVTMVYTPPITAPNAVAFAVYGPDGALINAAQLDTFGDNTSIPQNCLNCHGGRSRYDAATNSVIGARFLPFDPSAFAYSSRPDLTLAAQEDRFRRLNRLVAAAAPTAATRELIEGLFPLDNRPYQPAFVPPGWRENEADARVYREVIAPTCRGCHTSFETPNGTDPLAFTTAAQFRNLGALVLQRVCGAGPNGMPAAEQTALHFYNSPGRAVLLSWLGAAGACSAAPAAAP